jgi:hypothetical protein
VTEGSQLANKTLENGSRYDGEELNNRKESQNPTFMAGWRVQACISSTGEAEAGGSGVRGQRGLFSDTVSKHPKKQKPNQN